MRATFHTGLRTTENNRWSTHEIWCTQGLWRAIEANAVIPNATYRLATTWGEANVAGRVNVGRIAEDVDVGIMSMSNFEAFCWGLERGEGERTALCRCLG